MKKLFFLTIMAIFSLQSFAGTISFNGASWFLYPSGSNDINNYESYSGTESKVCMVDEWNTHLWLSTYLLAQGSYIIATVENDYMSVDCSLFTSSYGKYEQSATSQNRRSIFYQTTTLTYTAAITYHADNISVGHVKAQIRW